MAFNVHQILEDTRFSKQPQAKPDSQVDVKNACAAHVAIFNHFSENAPSLLKVVDGVPQGANIIRSAVRSADLDICKDFAEFGGGIFVETEMVGILSELYQSMASTQANWEIKSQSGWFISSLCMSVVCAALYHLVDDSIRSLFFCRRSIVLAFLSMERKNSC